MSEPVVVKTEWHLGAGPEKRMKHLTIFFYGEGESETADRLVAEERKTKNHAMSRSAAAFAGEKEPCDRVVILPGVAKHHAADIAMTYFDKLNPVAAETALTGTGLAPSDITDLPVLRTQDEDIETSAPKDLNLTAQIEPLKKVHRGLNRWFVYRGKERVDGPMTEAQADEIVAASVRSAEATITGQHPNRDPNVDARPRRARR